MHEGKSPTNFIYVLPSSAVSDRRYLRLFGDSSSSLKVKPIRHSYTMTFTATRWHQFISWQWGTWTLDPDRSCLRVRAEPGASSYLVFQVQRQVIVFSPGDIHRSIRSSIIRPEVEVDLKHLFCSSWNRQNVKCSCRCCVAGATNMQRDTEMCKGIRRHRGSIRLSLYKNIVHIFID